MKKAMYFEKIEESKVRCCLCPHNCAIPPGGLGVCGVRKNIDGELYSLNYGKVSSVALDPVEKKPLHHFHPGSFVLSAGSFGCNLKCSFCQNWHIAHDEPYVSDITPEFLVKKSLEYKNKKCIGIAYTYNEPSIWYEFVYETSQLARQHGLVNVLVTNGFINEKPLRDILPFIDAMNIDVKAFTEYFYRDICKASIESVKRTVEIAAEKCHVEVTTLVIPGKNDSADEITEIAKWIASIDPDIPLHLSRFFPSYKMKDVPPTHKKTLFELEKRASAYLKNIYLGNI